MARFRPNRGCGNYSNMLRKTFERSLEMKEIFVGFLDLDNRFFDPIQGKEGSK